MKETAQISLRNRVLRKRYEENVLLKEKKNFSGIVVVYKSSIKGARNIKRSVLPREFGGVRINTEVFYIKVPHILDFFKNCNTASGICSKDIVVCFYKDEKKAFQDCSIDKEGINRLISFGNVSCAEKLVENVRNPGFGFNVTLLDKMHSLVNVLNCVKGKRS